MVADPVALVTEIGQIGKWLQALGIIVVAWIIFESIALWFNYKRWREVGSIKQDVYRIERKIDNILRKPRK